MEVNKSDLLALFRTLDTLKPYLEEIVIVGGWVPFLYRKYGEIPARHPSVRTMDIDIAVPRQVPDNGRPTVDNLLSKAGYTAKVLGPANHPVVKYELASPVTEIEFITPEIGRPGEPSIVVQNGLRAQSLRYVQIVLENTRQIRINDSIAGININSFIRVPSPAAFVFQKALTLPLRRLKAAKDLYYIFNLLDSTTEMQDLIPAEIRLLQAQYASKWLSSAIRSLDHYFPESGGVGPALVATQYTGAMNIEVFRNYTQRIFRDFVERLK
jgi:hypothetical protein